MILNILEDYKKKGLIDYREHPTLPLKIWCYTRKTEYEGAWDYVTRICRGLVTDEYGVIAGGLGKFFNIEENRHTPTDSFEIYEKLDGSLIIGFWYKKHWVVATKGSFTSKQAQIAQEIFNTTLSKSVQYGTYKGYTYYFELTGSVNKIVVDYLYDAKLTVLAAYRTFSLTEVDIKEMNNEGFEIVQKHNFCSYSDLKQLNLKNKEGFVVKFSNGDRCKIKFDDYVQIHKIISKITKKEVWKMLKENKFDEYIQYVPDEFLDEVFEYRTQILNTFQEIEHYCLKTIEYYSDLNIVEFIQKIEKSPYKSILINMKKGKPYEKLIYKLK